ncbi:MAG: aminotransferase class I/II-fold pyridoxal phosphate-dependent enzyme [Solobacterium sp.]|nr:aminotransferase class I/II-fold pyridoxal phosphate-dependent enzyme [Solobacterium sp.]
MAFPKQSANLTPHKDSVFTIVEMAKKAKAEVGEENIVDATIGSLYDENSELVAFESVFDHYDTIDHRLKAKYGSIAGNPNYLETVYQWVMPKEGSKLSHCVVATPGGTGAITSSFITFLEANQTIILPDVAWGSYRIMANQFQFDIATYEMFEDDHFNLASLKAQVENVKQKQDRVVIVLNSPCHNPTGYSLSMEEWKALVSYLNEVSKENQVILINDIAYIDYGYDVEHMRDYIKLFDTISDQFLVMIAFSCSKTVTSYGLRCGAAIALAQNEQDITDVKAVLERTARVVWSNIPNAAMENFVWVINENQEAFLKEKQIYIDLMKERSALFVEEAKQCNLPIYPYKEGFFVTLKIEDNEQAKTIHEAFLKNHIYTVLVNKGIRIALCSLRLEKIKGLAQKMQAIIQTL